MRNLSYQYNKNSRSSNPIPALESSHVTRMKGNIYMARSSLTQLPRTVRRGWKCNGMRSQHQKRQTVVMAKYFEFVRFVCSAVFCRIILLSLLFLQLLCFYLVSFNSISFNNYVWFLFPIFCIYLVFKLDNQNLKHPN